MATRRQERAIEGELLVVDGCRCLRCAGALRPLRRSTAGAVVGCVECGTPAQVRVRRWAAIDGLPRKVMGAAWAPQEQLLDENRLHDLFLVLVCDRDRAVYALPAAAQDGRLFRPRGLPGASSDREGGRSFTYELEPFWACLTRVGAERVATDLRQVVRALRHPSPRASSGGIAASPRALSPGRMCVAGPGATVLPFRR